MLVAGCAGATRPMYVESAHPGTLSASHHKLLELPAPQEPVVAAVYRFRDQTGQYKASDRIASWSTAVTQGATSILLKSLEDSGWFIPIERENISNLLNERNIIQQIRQQHAGNAPAQPLPPLLFAGVVLEGGIIGYDTNIMTGGAGARYLGIGASTNYRKDQVTIYLRAVSTQSGRILKTVHTTKSVISQQLDSGVFRFISQNRLLEAEAGFTYNEPVVMAVTEAIDEAVKMLIIEGIDDGLWLPQDQNEVETFKNNFAVARALELQQQRDYFGFTNRTNLRSGWHVHASMQYGSIIGNYANPDFNLGGGLQIERGFNNGYSLSLNADRNRISAPNAFSASVNAFDFTASHYFLYWSGITPYVSAGGGSFVFDTRFDGQDDFVFPYAAGEAGLDIRSRSNVGLRAGLNYRYLLVDGLDGVALGRFNDQHWSFRVSVTYRFRR